ncbi:unnamed protein product [Darwinula stevensoni]|uniref:Uncharacterized protein n=1 Tax=Darwinula stevensoni TaxID=69355 RepID=A0A7R8X9K5_9CRUS|nr:unnamed protein product [Darwinula stevensoni]CAG0891187.1 unnamed protein product [Darwinula stevensoni]
MSLGLSLFLPVAAKIKNLQDYYGRVMNNVQPLPSGVDISNTIKYFSQVLLGVLRDVPQSPLELLRHGGSNESRLALFPNLDYIGLFEALIQTAQIVPLVPSASQWYDLVLCQHVNCPKGRAAEAVQMCQDHSISIFLGGDSPPPLFVCPDCAEFVHSEWPSVLLEDLLFPLQQVSLTCENKVLRFGIMKTVTRVLEDYYRSDFLKVHGENMLLTWLKDEKQACQQWNCRSQQKAAVSTCFSMECASYNGNHPMRYCQQCHNIRHNERRGYNHAFSMNVSSAWSLPTCTQPYCFEAIISLLKEAQLPIEPKNQDTHDRHVRFSHFDIFEQPDPAEVEERRLISRFGIYLLVGLCKPQPDTPIDVLGRLLSMLFQWFHATACLPDDKTTNTLEQLKSDYVQEWLQSVMNLHPNVVKECLLPLPVEYARVGGNWESQITRAEHVKQGLSRLLCLVPYELISLDLWTEIMPFWMEAINTDIPEAEYQDIRVVLT